MDSLPYIDTEINDSIILKKVQMDIDREINNQTNISENNDYAYAFTQLLEDDKFVTPILKEGLSFYDQNGNNASKRKMISTERYELPYPVKSESDSAQVWQDCLDNARAQLQHQFNRAVNIELATNNSAPAWRINNRILLAMNNQLDDLTRKLDEETKDINWRRKQSQEKCFTETETLKTEFYELIKKNIELRSVCDSMENSKENS